MSSACLRCGFPNDEKAQRCRACSAPLQDASGDATIKPRLRQIIAETRARTRARQRRGVSVDPNRVDVVPRLPSGVAASETALKTALEKGRLARLQGLREELRKGRPEVDPPARESIPPQSTLTPQVSEPKPERAEEPAPAQTASRLVSSTPQQADAELAAQRFLEEPQHPVQVLATAEPKPIQPSKAAPAPKAPIAVKIETSTPAAAKPAAPALVVDETELAAESKPPVALESEPVRALDPEPSLSALPSGETKAESERLVEPVHAAETPTQKAPKIEGYKPAMALPIEEHVEQENPSIKPLLSAAAKTALSNLRQTAHRLKQKVQDDRLIVDEKRCRLYDKNRLFSALIDFAPSMALATLWLSAQFNQSRLPPEEVMASWLLGESGGTPWGLLMVAVFWLVWCWAGIAVWNVTPGMKVARLSWSEASKWKLFARPPLFLLSLLPLGLGGTYALLDKNSRGLSDLALRLTWRKL